MESDTLLASAAVEFSPPCPKCRTPLTGIDTERVDGSGVCGGCATTLQYFLFPARRRMRPVARAVRTVEGAATCYFHTANQAAAICENCGRYVCAVCEVGAEDGRKVCPPCVGAARKKVIMKADEIVNYKTMARGLALFPLILMWPLTCVTAPATIALAVYGWRKPRSLVSPGSGGFVLAIVMAALQIAGWIVFGIALGTNGFSN